MDALTVEQMLLGGVLLSTLGLFLWGRWRHDVVALAALLAAVALGLVPGAEAFDGFAHPAVITVACVLVLSRGLQTSGAVDVLARRLIPERGGRLVSMAALVGLGAGLSAFMNNVGAMALLMPVAVQLAGRLGLAPGQVLMPLAFGTILGGMTTLVGTPPNLIVSGARESAGLGSFAMFDFSPVGVAVAAAGLGLVLVLGRWLVPVRRPGGGEDFETAAYFTEVRVGERSKAVGETLRALEAALSKVEAQIVGLVRRDVRMHAPHGGRVVQAGDVLVVEADVDGLAEALSRLGLTLEEQQDPAAGKEKEKEKERQGAGDSDAALGAKGAEKTGQAVQRMIDPRSAGGSRTDGRADPAEASGAGRRNQDDDDKDDDDKGGRGEEDIVLRELAVLPGSALSGRTATELSLRTRHGINLLAVSRERKRPRTRLRQLRLRVGDVLLMQGPADVLADFATEHGCVPLAERSLRIPDRRMAILSVAIMGLSVGLATLGIVPTAVAFALGVLASMLLRTVPPRSVYGAIDWPVIVLLGALIPVAGAMEETGTAALIAEAMVETVAQGHAVGALVLVMVVTMVLSDVMNNAATAAVMAPIALGIATALGVQPDGFLMAVAIGASCAFLTPIGHQNNTLILGPGGFGFGDYWRLGLPLEVVVVAVSVPLLLVVWPL
ncbi:MAG: SLC13 family permease [Alkalilacustris sp.]